MKAASLGALFRAEVVGDPEVDIDSLVSLDQMRRGGLSYYGDPKYAGSLQAAAGGVVLTRSDLMIRNLPLTYLLVEDPKACFIQVAQTMRSPFPWKGISPLAVVDPSAHIHPTAAVGPHAVIGPDVQIGRGSVIFPFAFIGAGVQLGEDCEIQPHVCIMGGVRVGNRVRVFAGSVLGSDGFGLHRTGSTGSYLEVPQLGNVVIEDDVRLGAHTSINRATLATTHIHQGVKMDDKVHVGHNCIVKQDSVLCAQVGLGGSVVLERDVVLGGQVGLGHGVQIGEGARLGGQSGTSTNLPGGQTYFFTPATPVRDFARIFKALRKLPELVERVRKLEGKKGGEADA